ncbi:PREDICTED: uncharacterized protein LOC106808889 [Priapulus caudatus]|uniref:Uncharacterized protein LOC106808889 n=1 Tax=Priapulus caudatus TaxID=37621 RepID=A0ABM1E511_PRICU|nr:PREDICTED: uncharacterized protein LOC106808889 [Priapulus caudatus]
MDMSYIDLLDSNGCPTHRKIIGKQQHSKEMVAGDTLVYAHFKAFKFPDVGNVFFECQCRLCMENCFQPQCGSRKKREAVDASNEPKMLGETRIFQSLNIRLPEDGEESEFEARFAQATVPDNGVCVSKTGFAIGMAFLVVVVIVGAAIAVLYFKDRRELVEVFHHNLAFYGNKA